MENNVTKKDLVKQLSDIMGFKVPVDGFMTAVTGETTIDVVALDQKLNAKFAYDKDESRSMDEFILSQYGEEACTLLNKLIL